MQLKRIIDGMFLMLLMLLIIVVVYVLEIKAAGLLFHTRDYPFLMHFYSTLFQPNALKEYIINPNGENFFGYYGLDGYPNFYYFLHFSPIKYISAVFYYAAGVPALQGWFAFMMFVPIVFIWCDKILAEKQTHGLLFVTSVCLLIPAWAEYATYDYRPIMLFLPSLIALIYFINNDKNELFLFALILCLLREEALIFLLIGSLHLFVIKSYKKAWALYFLSGLYALVLFLYYYYSPYNLGNFRVVYYLCSLGAFVGIFGLFSSRISLKYCYVTYANLLYLVPFIYGFYKKFYRHPIKGDWNMAFNELFFGARWFLLSGLSAVFVAVFVYEKLLKNKSHLVTVILSVLFLFVSGGYFYNHNYVNLRRSSKRATPYLELKDNLIKNHVRVLTGFEGLQAFYDMDNVAVWQRLPIKNVPEPYLSMSENNAKYLIRLSDTMNVFIGYEYEYMSWQQKTNNQIKMEVCFEKNGVVFARNLRITNDCNFLKK